MNSTARGTARESRLAGVSRGLAIAALAGSLSLAGVPAQGLPGSVLLDNCRKSSDELHPLEGGVCWGYRLGVWNAPSHDQAAGRVPTTICPEDQLTVGQLTGALLAWAEGSPNSLGREAAERVLTALHEAFPALPRETRSNALGPGGSPAAARCLRKPWIGEPRTGKLPCGRALAPGPGSFPSLPVHREAQRG